MNPQISVFIPVYNAAHALELALAGYYRQSCHDFDVWIADDGSGPEVRELFETCSRDAPFPVRYVCQPDEGFRKCRILNQAVRESAADYLIFADSDCIPHSEFVRAHWERREAQSVLCGRRVHLTRKVAETLTRRAVLDGALERFTFRRLIDALFRRGGHWDEGIRIRNRFLHSWVNYKEPTLLGSNYSLNRRLLEEINGFNEDFVGYGAEDTELEYRLRLAGAGFRWVRHQAIQYHLYHEARTGTPANLETLARTQSEARAACRNGLTKYP